MEEGLTAFFQKDVDGEGATLYKHLCDVLGKAIDEKPSNVIEVFEQLSMDLKYSRFRPSAGPDKKAPDALVDPAVTQQVTEDRAKLLALRKLKGTKIFTSSAEDKVGDFLADSQMLKQAGVGFSPDECYQISMTLKGLANTVPNCLGLRFFGKILGISADYWVYEGELAGTGVSAEGQDVEARGTGLNKYTYWVSTSPLGELTQLPDCTPEDIKSARLISKLMKGDLNADVKACPWYAGKEVNYLRAQIAQIASDCTLNVAGYYAIDDESGKMVKTEEFAFPGPDDLAAQASWVHTVDFILDNGKTKYPDPESLGEDEAAKWWLETEMEACPPVAALRWVNEDKPNDEGDSTAWKIATKGDLWKYAFPDGEKSYATTVVSSNRWPGAYTVSAGGRVCNVYVGYGHMKQTDRPVVVPFIGAKQLGPPPVMGEPAEYEEQPEPNPPEEEAASDGGDVDEQRAGDA